VSESISPRSYQSPEIRYQPSLLSVPSAANTVAPEETSALSAQRSQSRTSWRKLWFFTAVSALVGTAAAGGLSRTMNVSRHVHSGSPGYKTSHSGRELLWQRRSVTVYLDGSLAKLGPQANEAVMQAFGQWLGSDPKLPALSFDSGHTSTEPKQDGKNTVSYAPITTPGHEHDVAITVTYANDQTGEIVEADVILNARYPMGVLTPKAKLDGNGNGGPHADEAMDCQNRYDAQNVVTHEAGHFFGLGEDLTERSATMFLSIDQCETHKRLLSSTDVGAVTSLYAASRTPEEGGAGGPAGCSFVGAPSRYGALLVSGLILGLGLVRRRRAR
jgi:Matrixin